MKEQSKQIVGDISYDKLIEELASYDIDFDTNQYMKTQENFNELLECPKVIFNHKLVDGDNEYCIHHKNFKGCSSENKSLGITPQIAAYSAVSPYLNKLNAIPPFNKNQTMKMCAKSHKQTLADWNLCDNNLLNDISNYSNPGIYNPRPGINANYNENTPIVNSIKYSCGLN